MEKIMYHSLRLVTYYKVLGNTFVNIKAQMFLLFTVIIRNELIYTNYFITCKTFKILYIYYLYFPLIHISIIFMFENMVTNGFLKTKMRRTKMAAQVDTLRLLAPPELTANPTARGTNTKETENNQSSRLVGGAETALGWRGLAWLWRD